MDSRQSLMGHGHHLPRQARLGMNVIDRPREKVAGFTKEDLTEKFVWTCHTFSTWNQQASLCGAVRIGDTAIKGELLNLIFLRIILLLIYGYACKCLQRSDEGVRTPEAGVKGDPPVRELGTELRFSTGETDTF